MARRLSAQDWIDFALRAFARHGAEALKADVLARRLGVSRGSFYWHFADLPAFHASVIRHWRKVATDAIIADIERHESREERLDALLRHAFGDGAAVEIRMRGWARHNADAARALREVDAERLEYLEQLLADVGVAKAHAATRATLLYWTYLGAALSGTRLTGKRLELMVAELKQIALSGRPKRS